MLFQRLAIFAFSLGTAVAAAQSPAPWAYQGDRGPLRWGKLDPAYKACSEGNEQSPIDIRGAKLNKALKPIEFHYIASTTTVTNTGNFITAVPAKGGYILVDGVRYDLQEFHFHHPSEEAVNGKLSDLDVHMVHKSADGKLVVVAVRFNEERGAPNANLAAIVPSLPAASGASAKVGEVLNPGGFLPSDRGYWTFMGSLTTPPCTEGVRWIVLQEPLTLSREQIHAFTKIFPMNSRPLQDRNGRRIEASE